MLTIPFLRPLYEFIYPPTCAACDSHLSETETTICAPCWTSLRDVSPADELFLEMESRLTAGGNLAGLVSAFHFEKEGTLQALIHELKYNETTSVGIALGEKLGKNIRVFLGDAAIAGVIPVPLYRARRRERGYNQSEFIAKGIRRSTGLSVFPALLKRAKNTSTQTKLNLDERQVNVSKAFELNKRFVRIVAGSSFLIVDDVITTGATIQECAHVLKEHGAANVYAASVALADHSVVGLI